jgi:cation transport ATPase
MIGDGVNDALALTEADAGISLRSGTDISRDSAAVCLFGDDLSRVPWAIEYAQLTMRVIRQNLAWAFGYNTIGVALAATGYLNPGLAAALMVGSGAFVIANTWRLHRGIAFSQCEVSSLASRRPAALPYTFSPHTVRSQLLEEAGAR